MNSCARAEPNVTFEWGGCSHDVAYGDAFARKYLDLMAAQTEPSPPPMSFPAHFASNNWTATGEETALTPAGPLAVRAARRGPGPGRGVARRRVQRAAANAPGGVRTGRRRDPLRARLRADPETLAIAATEGEADETAAIAGDRALVATTAMPPLVSAVGGARRTRLSNLIDSWNNNAGRRVRRALDHCVHTLH